MLNAYRACLVLSNGSSFLVVYQRRLRLTEEGRALSSCKAFLRYLSLLVNGSVETALAHSHWFYPRVLQDLLARLFVEWRAKRDIDIGLKVRVPR